MPLLLVSSLLCLREAQRAQEEKKRQRQTMCACEYSNYLNTSYNNVNRWCVYVCTCWYSHAIIMCVCMVYVYLYIDKDKES